jgi:hypothetical protein
MTETEVCVAITFGAIIFIVGIVMLTGLIRTWIKSNKNNYDEEKFDRLARAFIDFKKETQRHFQQIERDNAALDGQPSSSTPPTKQTAQKKERAHTIEIDEKQAARSNAPAMSKKNSGRLQNMLHQKQE